MWKITELNIIGVKGVLDKAGDFKLKNGKSLALFAPNGCGKSGYVDALEYLFSQDGHVEHLGKGDRNSEHGGNPALPHILAEEKALHSEIFIVCQNTDTGENLSISRCIKTGRSDPISQELNQIIIKSPACRILRQHDLRRFVVDMQPREKYAEMSRWLGLEHLESILTHLTTTKNELERASPDREIIERLRDIGKNTNGIITEYDISAIYQWCSNEVQMILREPISIKSQKDFGDIIGKLEKENSHILEKAGNAAKILDAKTRLEQLELILFEVNNGLVPKCRYYFSELKKENDDLIQVREITKESVFQDIWTSNKIFLENNILEQCPVCLTPWQNTTVGSQKNACVQLTESLSKLAQYTEVQSKFYRTQDNFQNIVQSIIKKLQQAKMDSELLLINDLSSQISKISEGLENLTKSGELLKWDEYEQHIAILQSLVSKDLPESLKTIEIEKIPDEAKKVNNLLISLKKLDETLKRIDELKRETEAYRRVTEEFDLIANKIQTEIGTIVESQIHLLKDDINRIYKKIQCTDAVPDIFLEPDSGSKSLLLRVNFHSEKKVPPAGYLSESQINTLGLAIFISSIKLFNQDFPFVVFDDIVSSYDTDHRARVVDVIAEDLTEFQVFITTHDERFYNLLKSKLQDKNWQFDRIKGWTLQNGPKRESDVVKLEQIRQKIREERDPRIAGNLLRQYIEEWLDKKCADYCAYTLHKRPYKEFDRTIFDFWEPFINRLKNIKGDFFINYVETNEGYQHFKSHNLLNHYSHYQANPYEWDSIGDVEYIFQAFSQFEKCFRCVSCSKPLQYDDSQKRLYCTCGKQIFPDVDETKKIISNEKITPSQ